MKVEKIHILQIEDNPGDAALIREILDEEIEFSCTVEHADRLATGLEKIASHHFDLVLLDLHLPDSSGINTFHTLKEKQPNTPIIIMSGLNDEQIALLAVRKGAQDYLLKSWLNSALLSRSIRYAIEREKLATELRQALAEIKTLSGLLPICASCKNIRDDRGFWHQVEEYVRDHSDARFTHGICPKCAKRLYPDLDLSD